MYVTRRTKNKTKKRVKVGAQNNKCRRKGKLVAVIWQRRGLRGGRRKREGEKKVPERLSLLVLAAVAPAVHGGCGAEQPIHPAHQGRTQHRKTGRKRGYSSWMHCLSVWRSARHKQSNTTVRERERAEEEIEGDGHHPVKTVKHIKITKTYGPGPGITCTLLYYSAHPWKPKQITQHIFMYCAICRLAQRCQMANITLVKTHIYKVIFNFSFLNLSEGWKKSTRHSKKTKHFLAIMSCLRLYRAYVRVM